MSKPPLSAPHFNDDEAARKHLEAMRWPEGPICPHCGTIGTAYARSKPGLYRCAETGCRKDFTVTVGTLFERSHIPLSTWFKAVYLLCSSKKGMSAHQLHRMLGITYKSAWFMAHRIREGMRESHAAPLGGRNKVVEADETYVGGKEANKHKDKRTPGRQGGGGKEAVVSLVERDGNVHSSHVPSVNAKTLGPIMQAQVDAATYLMTDESRVYPPIGKEFNGHGTVNHSIGEYVRGGFWHTNTVENYFSILKRGLIGTYHHVSAEHLKRYVGEFDFRYNSREVSDIERADLAMKGIEGKRLLYRDSPAA